MNLNAYFLPSQTAWKATVKFCSYSLCFSFFSFVIPQNEGITNDNLCVLSFLRSIFVEQYLISLITYVNWKRKERKRRTNWTKILKTSNLLKSKEQQDVFLTIFESKTNDLFCFYYFIFILYSTSSVMSSHLKEFDDWKRKIDVNIIKRR